MLRPEAKLKNNNRVTSGQYISKYANLQFSIAYIKQY